MKNIDAELQTLPPEHWQEQHMANTLFLNECHRRTCGDDPHIEEHGRAGKELFSQTEW